MFPRNVRLIRLSRRLEPFDSDQFIFELKIDGFRSLAYIENGKCDLVSRNGNTFRNSRISRNGLANLRVENAVIDGEIACVDELGRSVFNDLLFRRRECVFFAFDLLFLNGEDLRALPLIERKAMLKRLLRRNNHACFTSITSMGRVANCSTEFVNSTLKALWRNGSTRNIDR